MVGLGVDVQDMPEYAGINELGTAVLLAGMARADVGRLVLASSMVVYGEGRYECPVDGVVPAGAASRGRTSTRAGSSRPAHGAAGSCRWGPVTEETAARSAQHLRRDQARAGAPRVGVGVLDRGRRRRAAVPQRLRAPHAAGHPVRRRRRDLPQRAGGRPGAAGVRGRRAAARLRARDATWPRRTCAALMADPPDSALRAYNIASGRPHTVGDMARALADAFGGPDPQVTGEYRVGDVRHVVASPVRAEKELGFSARVEFEDGMRAFATDPLRAAPSASPGAGGRRPRRRSPAARRARARTCRVAGGRNAVAGSSQTMNGSQIRSVSPRTRPDRSLTAMPASAASGSQHQPPAQAGQSGDDGRAGGDRRGGHVGREEVVRVEGTVLVRGAVAHPLRVDGDPLEPRSSRRRRRRRTPAARRPRPRRGCGRRHPSPAGPSARGRRRAPAARPPPGRRTGRGCTRAAARRASARRCPAGFAAASASSATPQAVTPANSASALVATHTAAGERTAKGATTRAAASSATARTVTSTAGTASAPPTMQSDGRPARTAEADAVEEDEDQQRTRRMPGDVGHPGIGGVHRHRVDERREEAADPLHAADVVDVLVLARHRLGQAAPALATTPARPPTRPPPRRCRRAGPASAGCGQGSDPTGRRRPRPGRAAAPRGSARGRARRPARSRRPGAGRRRPG